MATRSRIGIIDNKTGEITSIYCHWDGYPEHNGITLITHYSDPAKIKQLMELGDLSSLGYEIGGQHDWNETNKRECTAYGRDRGDIDTKAKKHASLYYYLNNGEQYNYLWDGVRWQCFFGSEPNHMIDLYQLVGV